MNIPTSLRDKRNIFGPPHYSIAHYCTDTSNDLKNFFGDDYFLNNLHLIPDSMKKNLADTIITEHKMPPKNEFISNFDVKTNDKSQNQNDYSPLSGIASFLSGVVNVISNVMFSRRKQTDFSSENGDEMAPPGVWHGAKSDDENKVLQDEKFAIEVSNAISITEMGDCRSAATQCQNKLDQVRLLLSKPVPCSNRVRRRPRKVFVEPGSVEDCFEDAFAPEDFETISNDTYQEYLTPPCYHDHNFCEIAAPKIKTESNALETTDVVTSVPECADLSENNTKPLVTEKNENLVASCEDKLSKLKALLQGRCKKVIEPEPEVQVVKEPESQPRKVSKIKDKHYKNINRCTDKRKKSNMRHNIQEDALFADEIQTDELSSVENSPSMVENSPLMRSLEDCIPTQSLEYFDEISGRFCSTLVADNEDAFQIVFNDTPRLRRPSDCDSEDSFIIFEDSPDSCYVSNDCYTTNDVFGDSSESDSCDSDSDFSDSGCGNLTFKLSHSLSKSVSNLTDDSLYVNNSEDEVDCSKVDLKVCEKVSVELCNTGLLIDSRKKDLRKSLPPKRVQFSTQPPKVHQMRVWAFAARQARAGHWERYALDRERFKRRIANVDVAVSWVLKPQHRSRVMFQRFMPWWNAEKRKEIAEKKREEELKRDADKVRELENDQVEQVNQESIDNIEDRPSAELGMFKESVVDDSQPITSMQEEKQFRSMNDEEFNKQNLNDIIPKSKQGLIRNVNVEFGVIKESLLDTSLQFSSLQEEEKQARSDKEDFINQKLDSFIPDNETSNKQVNRNLELDKITDSNYDQSIQKNNENTEHTKKQERIQQAEITESETALMQDTSDNYSNKQVHMQELNTCPNNLNLNKSTSANHEVDIKRSLENMQERDNCDKDMKRPFENMQETDKNYNLEPTNNEAFDKSRCKVSLKQDTVNLNTESKNNNDDKYLEIKKHGSINFAKSKCNTKTNLSQNDTIIPYNDKVLVKNT